MEEKSNLAKGRDSFDATIGNSLVTFLNKNVTPYPTEVSGPKFDLVPVEKQKDIMLNVARLHAQQEYNRIMDLVAVLQTQAHQIKRRLEITDRVYAAEYKFQVCHNRIYWLVYDHSKQINILSLNGPDDWACGSPESYQYECRIKWLGDHTWIEVDALGNPL